MCAWLYRGKRTSEGKGGGDAAGNFRFDIGETATSKASTKGRATAMAKLDAGPKTPPFPQTRKGGRRDREPWEKTEAPVTPANKSSGHVMKP
jgi:hypothetical protein